MEGGNKIFTITVDRTLDVVLDLITRRKAFAVIDVSEDVEVHLIDDESGCFYELLAPLEHPEEESTHRLLFIGESIPSRDDEIRGIKAIGQLADLGIDENVIRFPSVRELYAMAKGCTLRCQVHANDEADAVQVWNALHLGIGNDKGLNYVSHDSSSITLNLQRVSDESESYLSVDSLPTSVDPAEFSVYDEMLAKMTADAYGSADMSIYGDDLLVEYSVAHGDDVTRCIATEFFTNHNWCVDPATLLTLQVKAAIAPQPCDDETLRFSHPTKAVRRMSDGKRFYLRSITNENNMESKFANGCGECAGPETLVSADGEWDNLVDFYLWLDVYRKELLLQ